MVSEWRADLHTHTTCSDGSLSPEALITEAQEASLSGLSMTDHDSVQAYLELPETLWAHGGREDAPLRMLTGVELTTQLGNSSIHVLGYAFDPRHPLIKKACQERRENRQERYLEMRENLRSMGVPIPAEIVLPDRVLGRPQIALELVEKGICRNFKEAFQRYLRDDSPAYVPGRAFPIDEGIEMLRAAGAWVILAHPMLVSQDLWPRLMKLPIDGVEAYYGRYHHKASFWVNLAMDKGWIITGGSDFHGDPRPDISLGASWCNQDTFLRLVQGPPSRTVS
jgi:3',5'-nucleoside bisphosphate phosphatase